MLSFLNHFLSLVLLQEHLLYLFLLIHLKLSMSKIPLAYVPFFFIIRSMVTFIFTLSISLTALQIQFPLGDK